MDVYEYRFDTPVNAFGMFSLERDPKGEPLAFAPDGYASGMGFFFRQGPRYIQVMASDQNANTLELAKAIAEDRAKNLPAATPASTPAAVCRPPGWIRRASSLCRRTPRARRS